MKQFLLNLFFPRFCLNCKKEGTLLCYDCFSLIQILNKRYCPFCHPAKPGNTCPSCQEKRFIDALYAAAPSNDFIIKKIISQLRKNYFKDLSLVATFIIANHLYLCNRLTVNNDFVLTFCPCSLKEKKKIGFDPAEEIAKEIAKALKIEISGNFFNKKVFLVNDVFTEEMDSFAKKIKEKGAEKVFALTLARD